MIKDNLWDQQLLRLTQALTPLEDKPEETVAATLKALWVAAAGNPMSVEKAADCEISKLDKTVEKKLIQLVDQRLSGVPLAHLTGFQQFIGVELLAGPQALIPRKETEILAQQAAKKILQLSKQQDEITLLDVCTGAGNLIVTLTLNYPQVRGYAADLSTDAVELAKENVQYHQLQDRVTVLQGDLLTPFDREDFYHQVDLLLCNPPYISSRKVSDMAKEISQYEPSLAFDGGPFGIKILNALIKQAPKFLKSGGWLMFEVGLGQGESFAKRLAKTYQNIQTAHDKNGEVRVVMGQVV